MVSFKPLIKQVLDVLVATAIGAASSALSKAGRAVGTHGITYRLSALSTAGLVLNVLLPVGVAAVMLVEFNIVSHFFFVVRFRIAFLVGALLV